MRLSEQIALLLGMAILILIGVFVSTRPSVQKNQMAPLAVAEKSILQIENLPAKTGIRNRNRQITCIAVKKKTVHKILSNDNLSKISAKYYGDATKWGMIYEANKKIITNPNALQVGLELLIPDIST